MTRLLLLHIATFFVGHISIAQTQTSKFAYQKFSADTVKSTIDEMTKELSVKHPGFYRYNSKDDFNKYIEALNKILEDYFFVKNGELILTIALRFIKQVD